MSPLLPVRIYLGIAFLEITCIMWPESGAISLLRCLNSFLLILRIGAGYIIVVVKNAFIRLYQSNICCMMPDLLHNYFVILSNSPYIFGAIFEMSTAFEGVGNFGLHREGGSKHTKKCTHTTPNVIAFKALSTCTHRVTFTKQKLLLHFIYFADIQKHHPHAC